MWVPLVPAGNRGELCEVEVDPGPPPTWRLRHNGTLCFPQLDLLTAVPAINVAQDVAHGILPTCPRASWPFQDWLAARLRHHWVRWGLVVPTVGGLVGWCDWALDGKALWGWGGMPYLSFLRPPGYEWLAAFPILCLGVGVVGVGLPLLLLDWLKPALRDLSSRIGVPTPQAALQQPIYPDPLQAACITGSSLAAACGLTTVWYDLEQWRAAGWRLPAWGKKLLAVHSRCVVSAGVAQDAAGTLTRVGHWPQKLQAIYDAIRAGQPISQVICATADKAVVKRHWQAIAGTSLCWQPDAGSGCTKAPTQVQDCSVTFWACPTLRALLATFDPGAFDPHQQGQHSWTGAVKETMVLALLGALPFLQPYCPQPGVTISFPPEKLYHFLGKDPRPWVKLAPEEESIEMGVQAWGCDPPGDAQWSAKATSPMDSAAVAVFKVQGDPRRPPLSELTPRLIECPLLPSRKPEWVTLRLPKGEAIEVTVTVQPNASCPTTGMATSFMLLREAH